MSHRYFGTDGVRGRTGELPITEAFFHRLGHALAVSLAETGPVLIGRDTRASGPVLEQAFAAGVRSSGRTAVSVGVMPTPGVAFLTESLGGAAGAVISASHNPHHDNGIKFFDAGGGKISDALQGAIETALDNAPEEARNDPADGVARDAVDGEEQGGGQHSIDDALERYCAFARASFPRELDLAGLRIGVDCAHGAMSVVAPQVLRDLGAELVTIGVSPDGVNINAGVGSTAPEALRNLVLTESLDIGVAFDGDGDRVQMVTADGSLLDGDDLLFLIGQDRAAHGLLEGPVVGTLMSNLALELAVKDLGFPFVRTRVGDRYVMEALREQGGMLGGETSGHILCLDRAGTGDGLVAALQALAALRSRTGAAAWPRLQKCPQVLINVPARLNCAPAEVPAIAAAVAEAEAELAEAGRVVLRASGTEPLIRVMVEGRDRDTVQRLAEAIAVTVREAG
jgi:phosphoglucosamine mutase